MCIRDRSITSLTTGGCCGHCVIGGASWLNMPGCIWIELKKEDMDEVCTVLKVELDGEIDLVEISRSDRSEGEV